MWDESGLDYQLCGRRLFSKQPEVVLLHAAEHKARRYEVARPSVVKDAFLHVRTTNAKPAEVFSLLSLTVSAVKFGLQFLKDNWRVSNLRRV